MHSKVLFLFFLCLISIDWSCTRQPAMPTTSYSDLLSDFEDPPNTSRPRVWWHWMNGNVTKPGVQKNLEWVERTGIGGVHNFDANLFTPRWRSKNRCSWWRSGKRGGRYNVIFRYGNLSKCFPDGGPEKDARYTIDLGAVKNLAEVIVNGKNQGIAWKTPFRLDFTNAIKAGENTLEIRITNLWVNRLIGDAQPGVAEKITFVTMPFYQANGQLAPSGLLGPVKILKVQYP